MNFIYFFAWLIYLPFRSNDTDELYNIFVYYQPKEIYVTIVTIITVSIIIKYRKIINMDIQDRMVLLFGLILTIGYIYAPEIVMAVRTLVGYFIFASAYLFYKQINKKNKLMIYLLVLGGTIQALIALLQLSGVYYKIIDVYEQTGRLRIIGTIGHVNQFSHFQTMIFLISIVYIFIEINRRKRKIIFVSIGLIYYSILITQTRGSYLAIAVSFIVVLFFGKKLIIRRKKLFKAVIILLLIESALFGIIEHSSFSKRVEGTIKIDSSSNERINCWIKTLKIIKEKPLTGYGTGSFHWGEKEYLKKKLKYIKDHSELTKEEIEDIVLKAKPLARTHNEYLQFFMENGILAFLLLMFMIFNYWKNFLKSKSRLKLLGFLSINGGLIISFFSFPLHKVHNLLLFGIILGISSSIIKGKKEQKKHKVN